MAKRRGPVAAALVLVALLVVTANVGFAQTGGVQALVGDNVQGAQANVTIAKTVAPAAVYAGAIVTYTVTFDNNGTTDATLDTVIDTLPAGFAFVQMAAGSNIQTTPNGTTGAIVWKGPFPVPAAGTVKLIYKVRTAGGTLSPANQVKAYVGGQEVGPASATVQILRKKAFLPMVVDNVTVQPPIHYSTKFESEDVVLEEWAPFLNYWRLNEEQWFWSEGSGVDGSNSYTLNGIAGVANFDNGAHDSLTMYLGPGSAEWTDYRYRAKFNALGGRIAGLWFRGTYKEVETAGQWVTGYYFSVNLPADRAELWQIKTVEDNPDDEIEEVLYHFSNPLQLAETDIPGGVDRGEWHELTVEVEGPNIRCYVDDELLIDFTDTEGSVFLKGTIGLYAYGKHPNAAYINFDDVLVEPLD